MSEIIETYQQEQEQLGKTELPGMALATVVSVNEDGLELIFDGETEASTKHFPCNTGVSFSAGQRALLMKVNGSYVALCPVGLQGGGGGGYLTPEDVVDNLTSTATDKPLSANQGRALKALIPSGVTVEDNLTSTSTTHALSANQGRVLNGKIPTVDNNLTSTSTTHALSAYQGKVLNDKIKTVSSENKNTSFSGLSAQSGRTGYISAPSGAVGVTAYSNNGNVAVSAYLSSGYCNYALHNFSASSQSGTIYFTFTKVT